MTDFTQKPLRSVDVTGRQDVIFTTKNVPYDFEGDGKTTTIEERVIGDQTIRTSIDPDGRVTEKVYQKGHIIGRYEKYIHKGYEFLDEVLPGQPLDAKEKQAVSLRINSDGQLVQISNGIFKQNSVFGNRFSATGKIQYLNIETGNWSSDINDAVPGANPRKIEDRADYKEKLADIQRMDTLKSSLIDVAEQSPVGRFMLATLDKCMPYSWHKRDEETLQKDQKSKVQKVLKI